MAKAYYIVQQYEKTVETKPPSFYTDAKKFNNENEER